MKILLLADQNSSHTFKWAKSLSEQNIEVHLFSITGSNVHWYNSTNIKIYSAGIDRDKINTHSRDVVKFFKYLFITLQLKKLIKQINPDIVHAHIATSYGFLGVITGFKPLLISIWGNDVYLFPRKSRLHSFFLSAVLKRANFIFATSNKLKSEAEKYCNKKINVVPFGVDLSIFRRKTFRDSSESITIGAIKSLDKEYGIEHLVQAFYLTVCAGFKNIKLLIVGDGSEKKYLVNLVDRLGIANVTEFVGKVDYSQIGYYHNLIDIEVYLSNTESFGVSAVEAMATQNPVVVSDVGGLPEVVLNNITGFVVSPSNPREASECLIKLLNDSSLRAQMGSAGRIRVSDNYSWENNLKSMIDYYKSILLINYD